MSKQDLRKKLSGNYSPVVKFNNPYSKTLVFNDIVPLKSCYSEELIFHKEYSKTLVFTCPDIDDVQTGGDIVIHKAEGSVKWSASAHVNIHAGYDFRFNTHLEYDLIFHKTIPNEYHYNTHLEYDLQVPKPVYLEGDYHFGVYLDGDLQYHKGLFEEYYYNTHLEYQLDVIKPIEIESDFYYNTHLNYEIKHQKTIPNTFEYNTHLNYYIHIPEHVYIENDFHYNTTFVTQFKPLRVFLNYNHFYYGVNIITEGFDYLKGININCILPHLKEESYDLNIDVHDINTLHYDYQPLAYIQFISGLSYRNKMKDMDFTFGVHMGVFPYDMAIEVDYPFAIALNTDNSFYIEMNLCDHNYTEIGYDLSLMMPHEEPVCKSIGFYYGIQLLEEVDPIMNRIEFFYNVHLDYEITEAKPYYFYFGIQLLDKLSTGAGLLPYFPYGTELEYQYHITPIEFFYNIHQFFSLHQRVIIDLLDKGCLPNQKTIVDEDGNVDEEETINFALESKEYIHSIRYKVYTLRGGSFYDLTDYT